MQSAAYPLHVRPNAADTEAVRAIGRSSGGFGDHRGSRAVLAVRRQGFSGRRWAPNRVFAAGGLVGSGSMPGTYTSRESGTGEHRASPIPRSAMDLYHPRHQAR
jgi:hypothetical protein